MDVHDMVVRGRRATCADLALVQGTKGADVVRLDLDAEWDGCDVSVAFFGAGETVRPARREDGTWPVPWEVLKEPGCVRVSVEGVRGGDVVRHASMERPFRCVAADIAPARGPFDPTESEWRALAAQAEKSAKAADDAACKAVAAVDSANAAEGKRAAAEASREASEGGRVKAEADRAAAERGRAAAFDDAAAKAEEATGAAIVAANKATEAVGMLPLPTGNILRGDATGSVVSADDAFAAPALVLAAYGASTQDGTPTAEAPKPVKSVTRVSASISGGNLWKFGRTYGSRVGREAAHVAEGTPFALPPGTYTFSCRGSFGNTDTPMFFDLADGSRFQAFRIAKNATNPRMTFELKQWSKSVYFVSNSAVGNAGEVFDVMLEAGVRTSGGYVPYAPPASVALDLGVRELRGLPCGLRDEVAADARGTFVKTRVGKAENLTFRPGQFQRPEGMKPHMVVPFAPFERNALPTGETLCDSFPYSRDIRGEAPRGCYRTYNSLVFFDASWADGEQAARELSALNPTVLCAAPEESHPVRAAALPELPAPRFAAWAEADVAADLRVVFARDVTMAFEEVERRIEAVSAALSTLDRPTTIPTEEGSSDA